MVSLCDSVYKCPAFYFFFVHYYDVYSLLIDTLTSSGQMHHCILKTFQPKRLQCFLMWSAGAVYCITTNTNKFYQFCSDKF